MELVVVDIVDASCVAMVGDELLAETRSDLDLTLT